MKYVLLICLFFVSFCNCFAAEERDFKELVRGLPGWSLEGECFKEIPLGSVPVPTMPFDHNLLKPTKVEINNERLRSTIDPQTFEGETMGESFSVKILSILEQGVRYQRPAKSEREERKG